MAGTRTSRSASSRSQPPHPSGSMPSARGANGACSRASAANTGCSLPLLPAGAVGFGLFDACRWPVARSRASRSPERNRGPDAIRCSEGVLASVSVLTATLLQRSLRRAGGRHGQFGRSSFLFTRSSVISSTFSTGCLDAPSRTCCSSTTSECRCSMRSP